MNHQSVQRSADKMRAILNILDDLQGFRPDSERFQTLTMREHLKHHSLKDYLLDNDEVIYKVDSNGRYQACCIHLNLEGYDIYVNTYTGMIEAYHGRYGTDAPMDGLLIESIDDIFRQEFEKTIRRRCDQ